MKDSASDRKFANTLARGLLVLQSFRAGDDGLTHASIAERTGLPKPIVSRLTYTLVELGYLIEGHRNGKFRLGPAAVAMGSVANISARFLDLVSEDMQALADQTGTLALVAAREGDRMMLIRTWRPADSTTIWLQPGHRIPLYGSSSGQAVLSAMPEDVFYRMAPTEELVAFRRNGYEQLLARGFTVAPPETAYAETITSVSIPFFAESFGASVGFSCGALREHLMTEKIDSEVGPALRDTVRRLEQRIGQSPALARRN